MSILLKSEIEKRLKSTDKKKLWIIPVLDPADQVNDLSIDLRLGNQYIVMKDNVLETLDPGRSEEGISKQIHKIQERVVVGRGDKFVLHPGCLVLGSTLEYIAIPDDLVGRIDGRSSYARLGLTIAAALSIAPGFKGVITLELTNQSTTPIVLYPGVKIAQLILYTAIISSTYSGGKYQYPVGPEFSMIHKDRDIQHWAGDTSNS